MQKTDSISTMTPESEASVNRFAIRNEHAKRGAANNCASWPELISWNPGRMMMSAPTNPATTARMRRACNRSPRNSAAPTVTKIGAV